MKILLTILLLASCVFSQTITYVPGTTYQTMNGWEAVAQAGHETHATTLAYEYPSTTFANYDDNLYAAMVDLGINRLRVEVCLNDETTTTYAGAPCSTGPASVNDDADPNSATLANFNLERLDQQMDWVLAYKAYLLAQTGQTLWINLCITDFDSAGFQAEDTANEYAEFVLVMVDRMNDQHATLPDTIEAILEPDAGENSGHWTATHIANNIVQANTRLAAAGYSGIPWVTPSLTDGRNVNTWYNDIQTANASALALIDEVSYHRYGTAPNAAQINTLRDNAESDGNCAAMTEWIGGTVGTLWEDLTEGRVCSWEQYATAFPEEDQYLNSKYFNINETTWAVPMTDYSKYLRSIFKYVRMGAVMKGVTNSGSTFVGLPFLNPNNTLVIPVKATGSGTVTVQNLPAGTYNRCVTIGDYSSAPTTYDSCAGEVSVSEGGSTTITFSGAGIGTVFNTGYNGPTLRYFFNTAPPVAQQFAEGRLSRISG